MRVTLTAALLACAGLASAGCATSIDTNQEEASLQDLCEQAEAGLASCGTTELEGFVEACVSNTSPEHKTTIAQLAEQDCNNPHEAYEETEDRAFGTFVGACTTALLAASVVMKSRNVFRDRGMTDEQKSLLRPFYGDLIDEVTVYWSSTLMNDVEVLGYRVAIGSPYLGQAFGRSIYSRIGADAPNALANLAHELQHAKQSQDLGGLVNFSAAYCAAYWGSGFRYSTHRMEVEAEEQEAYVLREIAGSAND